MSDEPNPLEAIVARLETDASNIAAIEPRIFNPEARWSRATAQAAYSAVTFTESRIRRGEFTAADLDVDLRELHRAERILELILCSDTEQVISDFFDDE